MKAVRLTKIGQPLELQEVPLPRAGERDVLVRVKAAGICHSDVHYRAGISPVGTLPQTLGHEIAGIVEETGSQVRFPKIGDRVCIQYQLS
jgi:propanol-preferring alcohol dehydrogenase